MIKQLIGSLAIVLAMVGTASAQRGGGGGGHGGGGGGGHAAGGYGGHYGGYGYGRGYYGGYGWGWGGVGLGYGYGIDYPYYGGYYDYGGLGLSSFGGYGSGGYGIYGGAAVVPYSSNYTPAMSNPVNPTAIPYLPSPLSAPSLSTQEPAAATVAVLVPEGAQVWFDNTLTPATGNKWVYNSAKLDPGKTYTLNIKARWEENGKNQAYDIPLRIVAGDNMTMDLTKVR